MPSLYHTKKTPKCKYCDKNVKHNVIKGRNKGYNRTCGDKKCVSEQYRDKLVNQRKRFINQQVKAICLHCKNEFIKMNWRQKWCKICVPNRASTGIIQRYDISYPEYCEMLRLNEKCPICWRKLDNPVIDHCHKTGKVRGMICNHCNVALNIIENNDKLKRALIYLNK